jgi:ATP-dependent DNA helicase RecG
LAKIFATLHFPETAEAVTEARERLALEELLGVIEQATQLKTYWSSLVAPANLELDLTAKNLIPTSIPFTLTSDQNQAILEILADLNKTQPMNRLLMGDVGSGKTVVAGIAAYWLIQAGQNAALIAPTQILAEQHFQTLQKILPALPVTLVTSATSAKLKISTQAQLFVGTHAILNQLEKIQPALIIYDEQHRFGVKHRYPGWAGPANLTAKTQAHLLTMSATPIPRSLMLSLFGHKPQHPQSATAHQTPY